jgi:hypothetical protein
VPATVATATPTLACMPTLEPTSTSPRATRPFPLLRKIIVWLLRKRKRDRRPLQLQNEKGGGGGTFRLGVAVCAFHWFQV